MPAEDKFFGKKFIEIIFDVSVEWAFRRFLSHVMAQQSEAAELVPFELLHLELVSHIIHGETFCFCLAHLIVTETNKLSVNLQLQSTVCIMYYIDSWVLQVQERSEENKTALQHQS